MKPTTDESLKADTDTENQRQFITGKPQTRTINGETGLDEIKLGSSGASWLRQTGGNGRAEDMRGKNNVR